MAQLFKIKRTNTILYCRRWAETVAFYRDRLKLEIAYQGDWLVEFYLSATAFLSVADQSRTSLSSAEGNGITLSFQIDDLIAVHRHLTDIGVAPTDIRAQVMGGDVFYIFDPEGTRIEFWCPVE
jgi:catechol 2,3-dioxygenase-like lactoylglutathione lyase family enzyme